MANKKVVNRLIMIDKHYTEIQRYSNTKGRASSSCYTIVTRRATIFKHLVDEERAIL